MKHEKINIGKKERRTFTAPVEIRMVHKDGDSAEKQESRTIEGYAAVFDSETEMFGGEWVEKIERGAFSDTLDDDVRALFNHDPNHILARTKSGTLSIWQDGRGLGYRFEAPNTTAGNDLLENIRNGNISQSSFGFTIQDYKWEERADGADVFTITKIGRLFDVSPVTFPAYETTEVTARSIDAARAEVTATDAGGPDTVGDEDHPDEVEETEFEKRDAEQHENPETLPNEAAENDAEQGDVTNDLEYFKLRILEIQE